MAEGTVQSIETTASPDTVFEVAADLERYPEWASGVREVEIVERDAESLPRRARFVIDAMVKEISYVLTYDWSGAPESMTWEAEPNEDIRELVGSYEFSALPEGGTTIVYALRVEPGFQFPGFLRRQGEKHLISTALRGLRRRAEDIEAGR
jgi:ribosome-associated toxin RatA of RatAB toxin-antitoxin module